jgi:hypothetical protein
MRRTRPVWKPDLARSVGIIIGTTGALALVDPHRAGWKFLVGLIGAVAGYLAVVAVEFIVDMDSDVTALQRRIEDLEARPREDAAVRPNPVADARLLHTELATVERMTSAALEGGQWWSPAAGDLPSSQWTVSGPTLAAQAPDLYEKLSLAYVAADHMNKEARTTPLSAAGHGRRVDSQQELDLIDLQHDVRSAQAAIQAFVY